VTSAQPSLLRIALVVAMLVLGALVVMLSAKSVLDARAATPIRPDLTTFKVVPQTTSVLQGGKVAVKFSTANHGTKAAGRSTSRVFLSSNQRRDKADVRVGQGVVLRLKVHGVRTRSVSASIPAAQKVAKYYVIVCADSPKRIAELKEGNNCAVSKTRVQVKAAPVVPDTTAPATPTNLATSPSNIGADPTPLVIGTAEAGSTVRIYNAATAPSCTPVSAAVNQGTTPANGSFSVAAASVAAMSSTSWVASATDAAGNISGCSSATPAYTYDPTGPAAPTLNAPASPDTNANVTITGNGTANLTVNIYGSANCSGSIKKSGTVSAGGVISESVNASIGTNNYTARVVNGLGVASECSNSVQYVRQSTPDVNVGQGGSNYDPSVLNISAGTTVTWHWVSGTHSVTSDAPLFDQPAKMGGTFDHTFPTPGSYPYHCTEHGSMTGTINVT
jgi:plastocyanin